MRCRTGFLSLISCVVVASGVALAANTPGKEVVEAARKRQESAKTLEIRFKQIDTIAPGGVSVLAGPLVKPAKPIPEKETVVESVNRLVLADQKVRLENNHPTWYLPDGKLLERTCLSVTNGIDGLMLYPTGLGDAKPRGVIEDNVRIGEFRMPPLVPIALTFRALSSIMTDDDVEGWKRTGNRIPIKGSMCEEYDGTGARQTSRRFWVDPQRDYVVRRIQMTRDGKLSRQCDIDYRQQDEVGWLPSQWSWSEYTTDGSLYQTTAVEILEATVNQPQPSDQFTVAFPPNCVVFNAKDNKKYRVRDDGTMRELSPAGEELPGVVYPPGIPWYRQHFWLLVSVGLASVLLGGAYWIRQRAKSFRSTD